MLLLSDGTVMAQDGSLSDQNNPDSTRWYQLTPGPGGSYRAGTWKNLASMASPRLYFASDVLPNGDVFVAGGEYDQNGNDSATAELYDPTTNTWAPVAPFPPGIIGDAPSEVLPDGQVLVGDINSAQTYTYNTNTSQWCDAGSLPNGDSSSEETWVKLPDGSILSYSITATINTGVSQAERYVPARPVGAHRHRSRRAQLRRQRRQLRTRAGVLAPQRRVFFLGGNSNTAEYDPATDTWAAGPSILHHLAAADAPGAMLPNGKVLFTASKLGELPPTKLFDFDPVTNRITPVPTPPGLSSDFKTNAAYDLEMLDLPSGQVLLDNGSNQVWVFTPHGAPKASWRPTIESIKNEHNGTFRLTGLQLNGISEGAVYGDDSQMATNYPIVRLADPKTGAVRYARTFDWSSTRVATGSAPETTEFTPPPGLHRGTYLLSVSANGISSRPVCFHFSGERVRHAFGGEVTG